MSSYKELIVWQKSYQLTLEVYAATKKFPKEELFGLVSQIRRAAVSINSNLAKGFSRDTLKDKCNFYFISLASLTELQNQS